MSNLSRMPAERASLLVVDVQERLLAKVPAAKILVQNVRFLLHASALVEVPVLATEQYPRGLGPTVAELASLLPSRPDKVAFSSAAVPGLVERLREGGRTTVLLTGIETHVCILHTALDLLAAGLAVQVAVDAVASRGMFDHDIALRRLEQAGAVLTTVETAVFEWLGTAAHPRFKALSALVQDRMKLRADVSFAQEP